MNIPEDILRYAKNVVDGAFLRTYDKRDLSAQRDRCLEEIRRYKELKSMIYDTERRVAEITNWLKEVEIKIASPEEIIIMKEKFTR